MSWQDFQESAEQQLAEWEETWRVRLKTMVVLLVDPDFWINLIWMLLASAMLLALVWVAISQYDTFLRLKPELCVQALSNERLLVIVMAAPLNLVFTLVATTEFVAIRKKQRKKGWAGSQDFWLYSVAMLVSWAALLWAMRC